MNFVREVAQWPHVRSFERHFISQLRAKPILLATLPRSGTHYARALLVNALRNLDGASTLYIDEVSSSYPLVLERDLFNVKKPFPRFARSVPLANRLVDGRLVVRTHQPYHRVMKFFDVIHLFRDPVPFYESYLTYMYIKRGHQLRADTIESLISRHFSYYATMIRDYRGYGRARRAFNINFLQARPEKFIQEVLSLLTGREIEQSALEAILKHTNKDITLAREKTSKVVNVDSRPLEGSFINNSAKRLLSSKNEELIESLARKAGIDLPLPDYF